MHPRMPLAFLAARAHCWLMVNLSSTRTPRSLSAELLYSYGQRSETFRLWWLNSLICEKNSFLLQGSVVVLLCFSSAFFLWVVAFGPSN